jgi:enoyl reductase
MKPLHFMPHRSSAALVRRVGAMVFPNYGAPDQLHPIDLDPPQAAAGQVRVRVHAAGVQSVDCHVRSGLFAAGDNLFPVSFPQTLGNEFAGVIDQIGTGVEDFAVGDEVLGWASMACYVEMLVVSTDQIVAKPPQMPWAQAGALSASGQTAHTALEDLAVGPYDTLLIHAAAGGVGSMLPQSSAGSVPAAARLPDART